MFIGVDTAQIFATALGNPSQPALAAIGGWIGSWEVWQEPLAQLSDRWYTIAYDHRGTGATVAPVASITYDHLIDDVFAVLDAYGVERCVLAAESAGALTALGAALRRPERVRGLVVVDGMYHRPADTLESPFAQGLRANYPAAVAQFVDLCLPETDSDHLRRWGRLILQRADQDAALALLGVGVGVDLRPELHRITQPTLVIHGTADALVPLADAEALAAALPQAELVVFEGTGHVPTVTRPDAVVREIRRRFEAQ